MPARLPAFPSAAERLRRYVIRAGLKQPHRSVSRFITGDLNTIRYEMLFSVRSKADISQLNLPHGTKNEKGEKGGKSKSKKTDMPRSIGKQSERSVVSVLKKKKKARVGSVCRNRMF